MTLWHCPVSASSAVTGWASSMDEVDPLETLPITPLMRSYLDSLLDYMEHGKVNADLHYAKEYELFSLFRMCYSKQEIASIFRDALSSDLQFFVAVLTHYKTCRTARSWLRSADIASRCSTSCSRSVLPARRPTTGCRCGRRTR